jgi:hypothetical protein
VNNHENRSGASLFAVWIYGLAPINKKVGMASIQRHQSQSVNGFETHSGTAVM